MLRVLRANTGNWIIKIFLGIIVIVFVFLGVGSMNSKRNNIVAMVNDEPITINEFQNAYRNTVEQMRQRFGDNLNDDLLKQLNVKQQTLDSLIEQKLVLAQADKLNIQVTDKELAQALFSIKAFQQNGTFDMELYKKVLGLNSMTPESFEALQKSSLKQQKVRNLVLSSITVSDMETEKWYEFYETKMAVDYVLITPDAFADVAPSEDEMKKVYEDNPGDYQSEPALKAVYIKFSPEDNKGKVQVPENQIEEYYNQNQDQYKTPEKVEARHILIKVAEDADTETVEKAKSQAMEIYEKAAKGEDFAKLAKEFSQGPSKTSGGYLGSFQRGQMVKPFEEAAFAMKAGDISKPVKTRFGWHIIKVEAKHEASVRSLAQATEEIKKALAHQEMVNMAYYQAGEAFDAIIDGDDFEQVALTAQKEIIKTEAFTRSGKGLDMMRKAEFAKAAFELSEAEASDVQQLGDDYYIIKVVEKIAPERLAFDAVKDRIAKTLKTKLQKEAAGKQAGEVLEKAKADGSLEQAAQTAGLSVKSSKLFKREDQVSEVGTLAEFTEAAFSLTKENPIYPSVLETSKGALVMAFKEKQAPAKEDMASHLEETRNQLAWMKQSQYFQTWVDDLRANNEIEIEERFLN